VERNSNGIRMRNPKHISNAISSLVQQLGIEVKIKQGEVLDAWTRIVGDHIAKVAIPTGIRNGKLFVHVTHSTWRNELIFLKQELIAKINKEMKQEIVKEIIFR